MAHSNHPQGCLVEEWKAKLPVLTLHYGSLFGDTLPGALTNRADYAAKRLGELGDDNRELDNDKRCEEVNVDARMATDSEDRGTLMCEVVWDIVNDLTKRLKSLRLSGETEGEWRDVAEQLKQRLEEQPLNKWS